MSREARRQALFRGRTVLIMILVGVLAFAALAVLSVYAPSLRSGDDGGGHALSKSGVGFAGVVKLLRAEGEPVVVSRGDGPASRTRGLLVMTPSPYHDAEAIRSTPFGGVRLVVLPKWHASPHPARRGWVAMAKPIAPAMLEESGALQAWTKRARISRRDGVSSPLVAFDHGERLRAGPVDRLQTIASGDLEPVLTDETGGVLLARNRDSTVYILSDPDLLNTMGLKSLATARVADAIVARARPAGPIIFDVSLHGFKRSRNVFALALEPPFLGGTLCAVAAALLAGMAAAVRFGPTRRARPPYAMGKEALVENTAGLIRMARREHRMADGYARLCRELAARAVGAPRQLDPDQLDAFLDRLSAQRGAGAFTDLARAAREAGNLADLMAVARKLYDWRLEMTRASR